MDKCDTTSSGRRRRLSFVGLPLVLSLVTATVRARGDVDTSGTIHAKPTNILLVVLDDLGYSDLSAYGGEIPTPNIDQLARGGLRFTQCYNSARCCPSRASLLTGLYPHEAGIGSFVTPRSNPARGPAYLGRLNDRCVTLAEVLGEAGYQTYMVGKWHVGGDGPIARGFDEFFGFVQGYEQDQWDPARYERLPPDRDREVETSPGSFYATDAFTDYALAFLNDAREKDAPWFLYLAHSAPHFPLQAPPETTARFVDVYRRGWDVLRAERFARQRESGLASEAYVLTDRSMVPVDREDIANGYSGEPNPPWSDLPADRQEDLARRMAVFAAMVHHVDQGMGRLVDDLKAHGDWDDTLILILSDNGACYEWGPFGFDGPSRRGVTRLHEGAELDDMGGPGTYHSYGSGWANLSNTPLRMYKHFAHEGGICTPLIAHWPRGIETPDRWVRDPVHVMDIMPTLCELAGTTYPERFAGREIQPSSGVSLTGAFYDEPAVERTLFFEHDGARAIRKGSFKAVLSKRTPSSPSWELYDLSADRCETRDLSMKMARSTVQLGNQWLRWARQVGVNPLSAAESQPLETPSVANKPLRIYCRVEPRDGSGVLLAHGGDRNGYALHVDEGSLRFTVRIDGELNTLVGPPPPTQPYRVIALLQPGGRTQLVIDGRIVAEGEAGGLIPQEPREGVDIGQDEGTPVGPYEVPHPYPGAVTDVVILTS